MIEKTLRYHLQPLVLRRQRLEGARRLALYWLFCAGVGLMLLMVDWLWGWHGSWSLVVLGLMALIGTGWIVYRVYQEGPDYLAMARTIEQQHPEAKALILAAVEQRPLSVSGQLGYLQEKVIKEAVLHGSRHDWLQSIPAWKRVTIYGLQVCMLLLFLGVLSQMLPAFSAWPQAEHGVLSRQTYQVSVTPGDTTVESGAPVVITARFDQRVPTAADLVYGPPDGALQRLRLSKNLDDPVFGGMIPAVASDMVYHVEFANRRSPTYRIGVYTHPRLVQADASIVYPEYTHLPAKTIEDTRRINVIEGSRVSFAFVLNKAVRSARLATKAGIGPELVIDKDSPNVLHMVPLTVKDTQRYELHLTDDQGLTNKMPPRLEIRVHANLPPELKTVFPQQDVEASPLEELALEAEVRDDYGLTGYGLSYHLAGTADHEISMDMAVDANDAARVHYLLALEDLQAQPDQLLSYYFWAQDVGPDGRPRRVTSDMYFAEIRPFDEIFRESESFQDEQRQQRQQQQQEQSGNGGQRGEQLVRLQKQIMVATWNTQQQVNQAHDINDINDIRQDLDVVRSSQSDALSQAGSALSQAQDPVAQKALQAAAAFMTQAVDHLNQAGAAESDPNLLPALYAEQSAYQELLRLRQREHQVAQSRNGAGQSGSQASARTQQQLNQLELRQRQDRYETQRTAQSQRQQSQQENLQVLNRLRDLARRQEEINRRLKEAQAALNQARAADQQQAVQQELKRLRDEQTRSVRDLDELQQRMEESQNRQRMADARERLEQSRQGMRQSSEAMNQGQLSSAVNSGTRVQRDLEQMRDDFQERTSSQFADDMRRMRQQARQLDQTQQAIRDGLDRQLASQHKSLADAGANRELADQLKQQQTQAADLIERMKQVSEASEASEPLLSRKLYDTLRRASTEQVDQGLEAAEELVRRNFLPQAQRIERRAGEGIADMRRGVEEAAEDVLGSEADALRRARQQLDALVQAVNEEQARRTRNDPNGARDPAARVAAADRAGTGDPNAPARAGRRGAGDPNETALASAQGEAGRDRDAQRTASGRGRGDPNDAAAAAEARGNPRAGRRRTARLTEGGGDTGPLTGPDYRGWSDTLREVEEMLDESDLRNEAIRVRERARSVREDYVRNNETPQWDLVQMQIVGPLIDLRRQVSDKLSQLESDKALVPIDRDPVPGRYAELVRRYFESLGEKQP